VPIERSGVDFLWEKHFEASGGRLGQVLLVFGSEGGSGEE